MHHLPGNTWLWQTMWLDVHTVAHFKPHAVVTQLLIVLTAGISSTHLHGNNFPLLQVKMMERQECIRIMINLDNLVLTGVVDEMFSWEDGSPFPQTLHSLCTPVHIYQGQAWQTWRPHAQQGAEHPVEHISLCSRVRPTVWSFWTTWTW